MRLINLVGKKFSRWLVLERILTNGATKWRCKCDCGNEKIVQSQSLYSGISKSCGCLRGEMLAARVTTHGNALPTGRSREYRAWTDMKRRCYNLNGKNYHQYGGVGITVCPEWVDSFPAFLTDMGICPDKYELDRIDNGKGYTKDNCRWVSGIVQGRNRRNVKLNMDKAEAIKTDTRRYKEIAKEYGVSIHTVQAIKSGKIWKEE